MNKLLLIIALAFFSCTKNSTPVAPKIVPHAAAILQYEIGFKPYIDTFVGFVTDTFWGYSLERDTLAISMVSVFHYDSISAIISGKMISVIDFGQYLIPVIFGTDSFSSNIKLDTTMLYKFYYTKHPKNQGQIILDNNYITIISSQSHMCADYTEWRRFKGRKISSQR